MNYGHFGELLKEIRNSRGLTQEQLAENICSVRQLSRIESGENEPSIYILHNISKRLNIDLQEFYRIYFTSGSFESYNLKLKLGELVASKDNHSLRKFINEIENMSVFQEGENLQYVLYGKAICSSHIDNNYELSNEYCIMGISIEYPNFNIYKMKSISYSNIGLTMINLMASNFNKMGKKELSFKILGILLNILEDFILNTPFPMYRSLDLEKRLYQSTSCNLSILNMNSKDYKKSLDYVNKGIDFSIKENHMRFLPELLAQKSRLLLEMGLREKAYEVYNNCLNLYKICRNKEEIQMIEQEIENNFRD